MKWEQKCCPKKCVILWVAFWNKRAYDGYYLLQIFNLVQKQTLLKSDEAKILNDSLGPKQLFEITHVFAVWHLGIEWHFSNLYIQGPNVNKLWSMCLTRSLAPLFEPEQTGMLLFIFSFRKHSVGFS